MGKIYTRLKEESQWKQIKEQNPENALLVRNIWDSARQGNQKLFAANVILFMQEAVTLGRRQATVKELLRRHPPEIEENR